MTDKIQYKGITTEPSDYLCADGELSECIGLTHEHGSLVPLAKARTILQLPHGSIVLTEHKTPAYRHYIVKKGGNALYWIDVETQNTSQEFKAFSENTEIYKVEAMGNVLIALTSKGLNYFLWQSGSYLDLGDSIPECELSFKMNYPRRGHRLHNGRIGSDLGINLSPLSNPRDEEGKARVEKEIQAAINKHIAHVHKHGAFLFPFFIRYALRLYDGSLAKHSAPILIIPQKGAVPTVEIHGLKPAGSQSNYDNASAFIPTQYKVIDYKLSSDLSILDNWSDIVKSVDIFISAPIYTYNQAEEYRINRMYVKPDDETSRILSPPTFEPDKIKQDILDCSSFYFLASIKVGDLKSEFTEIKIEEGHLESIRARELMTDDYNSHDTVVAKSSFAYNNRLNLSGISSSLFQGFSPACQFQWGNSETMIEVQTIVFVKTDKGDIILSSPSTSLPKDSTFGYFYYPNSKAYKAYLSKTEAGAKEYFELNLDRHDFLNGAVFFSGMSGELAIADEPPHASARENLIPQPSKIYTSEVNNPFFFPVSGINSVGSGQIIGISSTTKALSQGQFGQFPLYAFTTEGVWALEVSPTGTYRAKQPISRDVCINSDSITQIDGSVLFASERGIMLISGADVVPISDAIRDHNGSFTPQALKQYLIEQGIIPRSNIPFSDFLNRCNMLYDYPNSRVIIYTPYNDPTHLSEQNATHAYVYSLKSKTWSTIPCELRGGVNAYPATLAIDKNWKLVDVSGGTEVFESGFVLTRPMKLGAPDVIKSISSVIQRGDFKKGHVKSILYGSRDLDNWFQINSSSDHILRGFRGTGYKYFRIALISTLEADESIAGGTIEYRLKQNDQPR